MEHTHDTSNCSIFIPTQPYPKPQYKWFYNFDTPYLIPYQHTGNRLGVFEEDLPVHVSLPVLSLLQSAAIGEVKHDNAARRSFVVSPGS